MAIAKTGISRGIAATLIKKSFTGSSLLQTILWLASLIGQHQQQASLLLRQLRERIEDKVFSNKDTYTKPHKEPDIIS